MDKRAKEEEDDEVAIKARSEGLRTRYKSLRDKVPTTNQLSSPETYDAYRIPLQDLISLIDETMGRIKSPVVQFELRTNRMMFRYIVALLNMVELTVDAQQRLEDKFQKLVEANVSNSQGEFKKLLRSIQKESAKVKKITPDDIQNLKWFSEYIRRQSEVEGSNGP